MATFKRPCYNLQAELRLWQWLPLCAVLSRALVIEQGQTLEGNSLLLKLWPLSDSLAPATITMHKTRQTHPHILHSHFPLSLSRPLLTTVRKPIHPNGAYLSCLSCISVAHWLCFKNANVMHYVRAFAFPLMPRTEEMDATRLIDQETQNTGSIGWTRGIQVCLRGKQTWPFHTHCSNSVWQWVWARPWISHAMLMMVNFFRKSIF